LVSDKRNLSKKEQNKKMNKKNDNAQNVDLRIIFCDNHVQFAHKNKNNT